ncbi:hypothetical protein R5R35_004819 [Gryllus longicercus]|uniref:G-protein coupled receptors family 2 profile 2 domain-containing protein n=1 Tax=Gryllus longicercus TaxID=2509291 RepID=A0AAN9VV73_9ORTH
MCVARWRVWWWCAAVACLAVRGMPADEPGALTVLKCCEEGEELDTTEYEARCHAVAFDPHDMLHEWRPHVYDPERGHLTREILPQWQLRVGVVRCRRDQKLIRVPVEHENTPSYVLFVNGSVYLTEYSKVVAGAGAYCLDAREVQVCASQEPEGASAAAASATAATPAPGPVVRKCCPHGATFVRRHNSTACEVAPSPGTGALPAAAVDPRAYALREGFPRCEPGDFVQAGALRPGDAELQKDGSLVLAAAGPSALFPGDFCVERMLVVPGNGSPLAGVDAPPGAFACHARILAGAAAVRPVADPDADDVRFTLYPVGLMLSVFFLAATLAAGCLLPGAHHALHWRCQTAHVACLMVGDLLLAVTQMAGTGVPPELCHATAVAMHFFFMAAFLWLNTMCWNIWWTFRDLHPARLDKSQEVRRLRFCHLYAWGFSFLIAGLGLLFDKLPNSHTGFVRPRFGQQRCWFADDTEIFVYFFVPMGITLTINLILFALTARALTCGLWKQEVVKASTERATLSRVCLKLVVVMGLTWVMDIISWAAGGPNYLWYFTDLVNALQGVFIFAVVGCQQQVWAAVNRLWCWYIPRAGSSATGQHVSTYSQGLPSLGESVTHSHLHKSVPLETMC